MPRVPEPHRPRLPGSSRRARRATALVLLGVILSAVVPWTAVAAPEDYAGAASGTVADVQLPAQNSPDPIDATFGESTGAVNSQGNIIPDVTSTPENETEDVAVGTASPLRVTMPDGRADPGSVQSSAPADAGGSLDSAGPPRPTGIAATHAQTQSQAAPDGSTARTDNSTTITDGRFEFHLPLRIPAGNSDATVVRQADGAVTATGHSKLGGDTTSPISAFNGYVTAAAIEALSHSTANGAASTNTIDFDIRDLRVNSVPGGAALVTANARPGAGDTVIVEVTMTVPGGASTTETITIKRGSNLLDAMTYQGTTLAPALVTLHPFLNPLTGPGGPLQDLSLILGGGYSDSGDGTYARGLVEAVKMSIVAGGPNSATITHTLGRAFSAADARRAFSTATAPALLPGTPPVSDPAAAFPESRTASPTQLAFTAAVPEPVPPSTPVPPAVSPPVDDGTQPVTLPADPSPAPASPPAEQSPAPAADEPGPLPVSDTSPVSEPVALTTADAGPALANTGLDALPLAALGLALLALGVLGRRATRPRAAAA
jgi:hypothetical protein